MRISPINSISAYQSFTSKNKQKDTTHNNKQKPNKNVKTSFVDILV